MRLTTNVNVIELNSNIWGR